MTSTAGRQGNCYSNEDDIQWIDEGEDVASTSETTQAKTLIRQNSVEDVGKTLRRQNSLHELDSLRSVFSNERSLSWDHYVDHYGSPDDVLRGLREIREELTARTERMEEEGDEGDFVASHKSPNLSKTSSKNTRCSTDVSGFSFESIWNSKQSLSLETFQSHGHAVAVAGGSGETSSGIKSISEDSRQTSSSGRWLPTVDSGEDPYEYDEEIPMEMSAPPTVDDELMLEVLCSERVSQMSKTYNDIEAVTRLLEEKEKDLELTARIGKELLSHNNKLESNVAALEAELKSANEKIEQITHELIKKTELIQVLTNDTDESGSEAGTPTGIKCINVEMMQRRVKLLEEENKTLRTEFTTLAKETESCEEQEQRLVHDITQQLANANVEREGITDDLERQKDENKVQYEQIISLNAKVQDSEDKLRKLTEEHDEMTTLLNITRENQNALAQELTEFKDRYAEVSQLLQDAQEDLRRQRKKGMPAVRGGLFSAGISCNQFGLPPGDSLASELESSLYSELSLDSGISGDRIPGYKKTFETVKCATGSRPCMTSLAPSTVNSTGPRMSARAGSACATVYSSIYSSDTESHVNDDIIFPCEPLSGLSGVPGSTEIAEALQRLTPLEVTARRAALGGPLNFGSVPAYGDFDATFLPLGCRTPDSIMSTGSSSGYGGRNPWRLPDKLQIVKPLEGSATLHHWSQLATPSMGGLLEDRPGVKTKGGRGLEDIGLELYTLSDLEEDDEVPFPGKSFQASGSVYTYTDSRVLHPDDGSSVTHSLVGSRVCTGATNSRQSTAPPTPLPLSRRNSCSTFSTSFGLAKMLNERGIDGTTVSGLATPASEISYTPTATPANSPDGSPIHSRSPSPVPFNPLKLPGFLTSGAELLRRTFISDPPPRSPARSRRSKVALSRSERKALSGIRIVEKVESMGLDTILATTCSLTQPTLQGALYTRRALPSPMAQLTSFKTSFGHTNPAELSGSDAQPSELGAPARPGSGALRGRRLSQGGKVRPDLGMVLGTVPGAPPPTEAASSGGGPLGTISAMLFGRKGGLL